MKYFFTDWCGSPALSPKALARAEQLRPGVRFLRWESSEDRTCREFGVCDPEVTAFVWVNPQKGGVLGFDTNGPVDPLLGEEFIKDVYKTTTVVLYTSWDDSEPAAFAVGSELFDRNFGIPKGFSKIAVGSAIDFGQWLSLLGRCPTAPVPTFVVTT